MVTIEQAAPAGGRPHYIGRYRIIERIGKGAMGMVFAAEDEAMGRRVAVKVMMADLEEDPETRERFYREAKVTGQLVHRNIVTVFDLGDEHGRPYIVMELLSGVALGEHLHGQEAQSVEAKLDLMTQVCEGLQVAHGRGVIHRDIKPSNLFVQRDGTLKILDFGVARLATSSLTASGFIVGTPDYMSPEQAAGRPVDARSDVFSAAGVFYFMLTGRAPFASPDLPKVLHAVMHDDPAPLTDADAPEPLRRVLTKALCKEPAQRYQQCSDMLADLDRVRRAHDHESHRVAQAALDRYRQILALMEERRVLGRELRVPDADTVCATATARLAARFPLFARHADPSSLMEPLDLSVASSALAALQTRHNTELGAVAALRAQRADSLCTAAPSDLPDLTIRRPSTQAVDVDPTIVRTAVAGPGRRPSLRARASAWWHRLLASRGQSTTEWLMIAGVLAAIAVFLVGTVPNALGIFMRAMATSLRTIAP
jgi:tRNA A-37 threonylcarbamoyl transferase component Bud32